MNDYEDGTVLMGLDGLFEGHAVPTSNLQEAVFYPFDNVIPQSLLGKCIVLACKRYTEQEIMNIGPKGTSELCVIYQAQGPAFYADLRFETLVPDIQHAYVFDRNELNGKLLASQNFIVPVRVRSVNRLELHFQQPNAINPYTQPFHFGVDKEGILISNAYIDQAKVRPLTDEEIEETKRKQEELARKAKLDGGAGKTLYMAEIRDTMSEGPIEGSELAKLEDIRAITSAHLEPKAHDNATDALVSKVSDAEVSISGKIDDEYLDTLTGQIPAKPPFSEVQEDGWGPAAQEKPLKRTKGVTRSNLDETEDN